MKNISNKVDLVLHCGAALNSVGDYNLLKNSNVLGTINCINLSILNKNYKTPFIYISSLSVVHSNDPNVLRLGYIQTKYVSERIVENCFKISNNPYLIIRPGFKFYIFFFSFINSIFFRYDLWK
jgi:thioester reductase-like protein